MKSNSAFVQPKLVQKSLEHRSIQLRSVVFDVFPPRSFFVIFPFRTANIQERNARQTLRQKKQNDPARTRATIEFDCNLNGSDREIIHVSKNHKTTPPSAAGLFLNGDNSSLIPTHRAGRSRGNINIKNPSKTHQNSRTVRAAGAHIGNSCSAKFLMHINKLFNLK